MRNDYSAKILVVDDNPATRYATSRILRASGFEVVEAATGSEGVARTTPDTGLVVLDVNLPDIDGFEVCRRIRANPVTARTPVLHLSATFVKDVDKVHGLDAGADGYLTHPVEPPVLVATVNAFLRARRAEVERERLLISERAARDEAERANRLKDDFLATLSHELRTPLSAIVGWTQVLQRRPNIDGDLRDGLEVIQRNANALAQLVADLLDVSRITSGKVMLDVRPVDPAKFVAAALDALAPAAAARGLTVERSLAPDTGPISADADRLQQVVWNLVTNAVKFTPRGGKIGVRVHRVTSAVEIAVSDDGKGISADFLPHIFERFRQEDAHTTRNQGGLGLGLAIVKSIVEMHGGTVTAHSEGEGRGATFIVRLPLAAVHETAQRAGSRPPAAATAADVPGSVPRSDASQPLLNIGVLVVDDDEDSRELLRRILTEAGANVKVAADADEALRVLDHFTPHVLLSDIGMPNQDGYDLIRQVRKAGQSPARLPAIALTAFASEVDRELALSAGFQLHLGKPVESAVLITGIARLAR